MALFLPEPMLIDGTSLIGGFTSECFPRTEQKLALELNRQTLNRMFNRPIIAHKHQEFQSLLDYMFCTCSSINWVLKCNDFYDGVGPRLLKYEYVYEYSGLKKEHFFLKYDVLLSRFVLEECFKETEYNFIPFFVKIRRDVKKMLRGKTTF